MKSSILLSFLSSLSSIHAATSNLSEPLSSHQILPSVFKPPQVFKNVNLLRSIILDKSYVKEGINVVIENTSKEPRSEYYIPFKDDVVARIGGFEVRDKKSPEARKFATALVEYDSESSTQFYLTTLPAPLPPSAQLTLSITYHLLSSLSPLPAQILQNDKQYLLHTFSSYTPSAYPTTAQKLKLKTPNTDVPDISGSPERQGSTFTYGPYNAIPAGAEQRESVRYEFTKPLIHTTLLERDVEVSHWGGNVAFEERYWLTNRGATLSQPFSRSQWASTSFYKPPTSAIRELPVPLPAGALSPYYTDEIGNISTSHWRVGKKEGLLELKPRYPVFGGWSFPFRIGWDTNAKDFLRKLKGDGYALKVPFLEGPRVGEGISYERVEVRVILPEGAIYREHFGGVPITKMEVSSHKTFMDTLGRTMLKLTALNVVDEAREAELIVMYDYPFTAGLRKPVTIFAAVLAVFLMAFVVGRIDVSIGKKA